MQILLACAKTMHDSVPSAHSLTAPRFQTEAEGFARDMMNYPAETIATMLGCSQQIARQNKLRFMQFFDTGTQPLPALLAYYGQAYKHLKAETLSDEAVGFARQHLWITSFLYGLLRPSDGIRPYRMEGGVMLPSGEGKNMFDFWKPRLTDVLIESVKADDGILVHLATEEFQHLFDWKRVRTEVRVVQPLFYVRSAARKGAGTGQDGNRLRMQAVWAKTCRGAMTRYIIRHRIHHPEGLYPFVYEGFSYDDRLGEPDFPHFIRDDQ